MVSIKKILCPTDFSEPSYTALEAANGLALQYSSELYLVNVVPPIPPVPTQIEIEPQFDVSLYEGKLISSAEKLLEEVVEQGVAKELRVRSIVVQGDPSDEIVKFAAEENVDLIVIATHGRTGWRHLVFGSVAEKVIRLAPCPVLVIRAPSKKT